LGQYIIQDFGTWFGQRVADLDAALQSSFGVESAYGVYGLRDSTHFKSRSLST
jgi:hypothetical protein